MWYQVNVEGSQPQTRTYHACTFLQRGGGCPISSSLNEIGRVIVHGGRTANRVSPTSPPFADLAFMSIGVGVTDELAKPQNKHSQNKLNKLLGNPSSSSNNHASTSNGASCTINNNFNNNSFNSNNNNSGGGMSGSPPFNSTNSNSNSGGGSPPTTQPPQQAQQQPPTITTTSSFQQNKQQRKTYSKLPIYNGSVLYHWENCVVDSNGLMSDNMGRAPSDRSNHSLLALNHGPQKGKIVMFGGADSSGTCFNDLYILDSESLWWESIKSAVGVTPCPRHSHYTCQITSDTVLVYGGLTEKNECLTDTYLLSLTNQNILKWSQVHTVGSLPQLKANNYLVTFCSNSLWVVTFDGEMYKMDTVNFRWNTVAYKGVFPVFGGAHATMTSYGNHLIMLVDTELAIFDTFANQWTIRRVDGDQPTKRKGHSISMAGSMLVVVGGQCEYPLSTIMTKDIEVIDLKPFFYDK